MNRVDIIFCHLAVLFLSRVSSVPRVVAFNVQKRGNNLKMASRMTVQEG